MNEPSKHHPKGNENMYTKVPSGIIHNDQEMKTTQISVNWWMYKWNIIQQSKGMKYIHATT